MKCDTRVRAAAQRDADVASLDPEQMAFYYEAIECGACHADAMDAAVSYGFTR